MGSESRPQALRRADIMNELAPREVIRLMVDILFYQVMLT